MYDFFNFNVLGYIFVEEISLINRNQQWQIQDFPDGGANPKGMCQPRVPVPIAT